MKRAIGIPLISIVVLSLAACSAPKSNFLIEDGAYNITPKEYIDKINLVVEAQGDSRYLPIPDFLNSGDEIQIDFIYLTLELTTNDAGNITEIYYTWDASRQDIGYSLGLYIGYTCELLGINDSDTVFDELDMMDYTSSGYETTYTENNTLFSYSTIGHGRFNYLKICPVADIDASTYD